MKSEEEEVEAMLPKEAVLSERDVVLDQYREIVFVSFIVMCLCGSFWFFYSFIKPHLLFPPRREKQFDFLVYVMFVLTVIVSSISKVFLILYVRRRYKDKETICGCILAFFGDIMARCAHVNLILHPFRFLYS